MTVVTPTDRPKSVRNRCLIELFCGVVCVVALPFWHFCWCKGFCHRTGSDLLFFVFRWMVMLDFSCMGSADLLGTGKERKFKMKICLQRDSNPRHATPRQVNQRLRWLGHDALIMISGLMSYRIMGYKASVTILAGFGPEFNPPFRWRSKHQTKNHSAYH